MSRPVRDAGEDHLQWRTTSVSGRRANYGVAGEGVPVLFLHGWALGQHAYKRALKRLVRLGCRVYAPAMPGFGGTADLPRGRTTMAGYAEWVAGFLDAVGVTEPVLAIGHSFGGGVAIQLAHDFSDRVGYLVLINSVGGRTWVQSGTRVRSMAERPLWDWGIHFPNDLLPLRGVVHMAREMAEDALPNMIRNPWALLRAGELARTADLTPELQHLKARHLPIVALWGDQDTIIPRASFEALCSALGSSGQVVPGRHSWLLADPDAFGEVMANSVAVARAARISDGVSEEVTGHPVTEAADEAHVIAPRPMRMARPAGEAEPAAGRRMRNLMADGAPGVERRARARPPGGG